MKKKYIIILIIVPLIIAIIYMLIHNQEKFYLNDKYYNNSSFIEIDSNKIQRLNNENYLLFTYNNYCTLPIPCEYIFEDFMKKYNISIISIPFKEFKKTKYYKRVKYAPTVIIIKKGRIISFLDANSEKDLDKYQNINDFEKWISKYIYLDK